MDDYMPEGIMVGKELTEDQRESLLSRWESQGKSIYLQSYSWDTPVSFTPRAGYADPTLTVFYEPQELRTSAHDG